MSVNKSLYLNLFQWTQLDNEYKCCWEHAQNHLDWYLLCDLSGEIALENEQMFSSSNVKKTMDGLHQEVSVMQVITLLFMSTDFTSQVRHIYYIFISP